MSLNYLKVHYLPTQKSSGILSSYASWATSFGTTVCGRTAPGWARRTTNNPDFVTCESCLDFLTKQAWMELKEHQMTIEEILDRRG